MGGAMEPVVRERVETIPREIIEGFKPLGVGDIGHFKVFGFMDSAIRPVWRDVKLVGPAVTVRMAGFDIGFNRRIIAAARPGDVIVVDRGGETEVACWGGFAALLAQATGVAGLIVDGAVTDSMEITDLHWPVYSRTLSGLVGRNQGFYSEINTPVSCGGVPVLPGDLIVADDDGIAVIRPDEAAGLLEAVRNRFGNTPNIRQWVRDGKSIQDYPGVKAFREQQ